MTRIAVDAMGGDHAPEEIVKGALWAAWDYKVPIELVGKQDAIEKEIENIKKNGINVKRGLFFKVRPRHLYAFIQAGLRHAG